MRRKIKNISNKDFNRIIKSVNVGRHILDKSKRDINKDLLKYLFLGFINCIYDIYLYKSGKILKKDYNNNVLINVCLILILIVIWLVTSINNRILFYSYGLIYSVIMVLLFFNKFFVGMR